MLPAVQALFAAVLACLAPASLESPRALARVRADRQAAVEPSVWSRPRAPLAADAAPWRFGEEAEDRDDDDAPARPRLIRTPAAPAVGAGPSRAGAASDHPAFDAAARPRFLLHGRLTC